MSIRGRLNQLKKITQTTINSSSIDHLVIGNDLYALEIFYQLKKREKLVKLVASSDIAESSWQLCYPLSLRGKDNIELFRSLFPFLTFQMQDSENLFYKDSKWREFGGRSRPEKILEGEDFYIFPRATTNFSEVFEFWKNDCRDLLRHWLQEDLWKLIPQKITYQDQTWSVLFSNGQEVSTKHLYWCLPVSLFNDLFKSGEGEAFEKLICFADSAQTPGMLYWRAFIPEVLVQETETLFIAQSYTHDWGHYIGECLPHLQGQHLHFISFINLDDVTEEELSRKIRGVKKALEKIYPKMTNKFQEEYILFNQYSSSTHLRDDVFDTLSVKYSGLAFFGENAPLDPLFIKSKFPEMSDLKSMNFSHIARGLASIRQFCVKELQ